jgi:prophage maintenance system killer protein
VSLRWLNAAEIIEINRLVVAETGEPHQILSLTSLEGAVARPALLHDYGGQDIPALAVRMLFAIAAAHAFLQGN